MTISHYEFGALLESLDAEHSPPRAHGLLCGLLCAGRAERAKQRWFTEILKPLAESGQGLGDRAAAVHELDQVYSDTLSAMNSELFEFELCLPDEPGQQVRASGLADWCDAFVFGLGLGGIGGDNQQLPADSEELIGDLQRIAALDRAEDGDGDMESDDPEADAAEFAGEDESALMELEEYVRVGILLIYEELQPAVAAAPALDADEDRPDTLH